MKAKRKMRTKLEPLAEVIGRDARNKKALEDQFSDFYNEMKKTIRGKAEFKNLDVRLEKVRESVKAVAHGSFFGIPMVTVEEPENEED